MKRRTEIELDLKKLEDSINKTLEQIGLTFYTPSMRYWKVGRYIYAWTTVRCSDGKFYALKYLVRKDKAWRLLKKREFKKRKTAKLCAKKWRDKDGKRMSA